MTGRTLFLLTALLLAGYTTAQTDPNAEEIDYEAFKQRWMISAEEVAQQIGNVSEIEERGQVPDISGLVSGNPIVPYSVPKRCEDSPIVVVFQQPGVWYWPAAIQKKCIARCPKGHECVATKTVTRQLWAISFKQFECYGLIIWVPIGIRRLHITDELKCECKPICKPLFCFPPRRFNRKICDCECSHIYCRYPFELDPASCQCRCPKDIVCEEPKILNFTTCECECPPKECPPHYKVDPKTCNCTPICQKSCPKGSYLDLYECQCVGNCPDFSDNEYDCNDVDSCRDNRGYKCRWFPSFPHKQCQCECCKPKHGHEHIDCGKWTPFGKFFCNYFPDSKTYRPACEWACGSDHEK